MLRFVDSHCHLDFPVFEPIRIQEYQTMAEQGVTAAIVPATTAATWERLRNTCANADKLKTVLYAAYGLHPYFLSEHQPNHLEQLKTQIKQQPCIAVGEFGLDYHLENTDCEQQKYYFEAQLDIAKQANLPVILHVRKAHDEVLKTLRQYALPRGGAIHAYSGSEQQAHQYIEMGFKLGFGGAATYERAKKLRRLVAELPLDSILLESDAPDMPPSFIEQGEINRPSHVPKIAQQLAEIRQISLSVFAQATAENADKLFGHNFGY